MWSKTNSGIISRSSVRNLSKGIPMVLSATTAADTLLKNSTSSDLLLSVLMTYFSPFSTMLSTFFSQSNRFPKDSKNVLVFSNPMGKGISFATHSIPYFDSNSADVLPASWLKTIHVSQVEPFRTSSKELLQVSTDFTSTSNCDKTSLTQ